MIDIAPEELIYLIEEMALDKFRNKYVGELTVKELEEVVAIRKALELNWSNVKHA